MSKTLDDLLAGLPTADDVRRWERASDELGAEIEQLRAKKATVDQLVARAKQIFSGIGEDTPVVTEPPPIVDKVSSGERLPKGIWTGTIYDIIRAHDGGISYEEIKEALPEGLREEIEKGNTKGFYGSLRRLERDKKVVRFNSHAFTPEVFERFKETPGYESLAKKGSAKRGSPMSDEIKNFLASHGASKALAIKEHLCKEPEFRTPLKRNSSALYNVLKRLVDRDELIHDKENSLYSLARENEAPNGIADGASETGEVGASSSDASPLFRVVK